MSAGTKIEWAANGDGSPGASWNPIRAKNRETGQHGWFCVHESEGCRNCYAERINTRLGTHVPYKAQNEEAVEILLDENTLTQPLRWKKPRTIFVCSMTDLFGAFVPDSFIDKVFTVATLCPQHTFIVLTKRSRRMRDYFEAIREEVSTDETEDFAPRRYEDIACDLTNSPCAAGFIEEQLWPLHNVWLGVSAEDQKTANARIPHLLDTPAALRFVSLEPLLGLIDLTAHRWLEEIETDNNGPIYRALDWVIVGGESGPGARLMRPEWARDLRDQCSAADVPYFFKQWGEWAPWPHWPEIRTEATAPIMELRRVGRDRAGRALDGVEHNARPPLAHQANKEARP